MKEPLEFEIVEVEQIGNGVMVRFGDGNATVFPAFY